MTETDAWEPWIIYMLNAIKETSQSTLALIKSIITLKEQTLKKIKEIPNKFPAFELNELIFSYPYVKIKVLEEHKIAKRETASGYLQKLAELGVLRPMKIGKEVYYVNHQLMKLLSEPESSDVDR